ncbi:MAG: PAS domain S-box protein [Thermodesulfobacteriota bacterium]
MPEEKEKKFYLLTQIMDAAIFIVQGDRFRYMNPAGERLCGYSLAELEKAPFWKIVHPDFRGLVSERAKARQRGEPVPNSYQFKIITKDGQEKWAQFTAGVFQYEGQPAILGTAFDITEHKQAQEELKASQKHLADIINFLPDPTFVLNREGRVIIWNRAIEELTGISAEQMLGKGDYEYALPFWGERRPILADLAMVWDQAYEDRYPFISRDGHTLRTEAFATHIPPAGAHLWGKATALFDTDGNITGAIETIRNITSRKKMEAALRESAEKHRALIQSLPVGVISVDPDFRITEINTRGREILGRMPDDLVGSYCKDVMQTNLCQNKCPIKSAMLNERPTGPVEATLVTREGRSIHLRVQAAGLHDAQGKLVGGVEIFQDVTEIKSLERERANLISMFAHDMKSPLVGIQGFALRLLNKQEGDKQQQYLEIIRKEAAHLEKIINDFLDFARLETGRLKLNFSATDLDKEFIELMAAFQPGFSEAGIRLEIISQQKLPVIEADAVHLRRAFSNLLENALKYSASGTTVSIELEDLKNEIAVRVRDQGMGIASEDLPYIFDMFYRGHSQGKTHGHGLGLAGVEAIVTGHGGRVMVTSEVGVGSVFTVFLPKQAPADRNAGKPAPGEA